MTSKLIFVVFNADPPHTGFSRRVLGNVQAALVAGASVEIVRIVPTKSSKWRWSRVIPVPSSVRLIELPVFPIRRSRFLRSISSILGAVVLRVLHLLRRKVTFIAESHEAAYLCAYAGVPFAVDIHGDVIAEQRAMGNGNAWLSPDTPYLTKARQAICVSEVMRDEFLKQERIREPCHIVPVGYSATFARIADSARQVGKSNLRKELGLPERSKILVYSGGLQPYQRFNDICTVVGKVMDGCGDVYFLVCTRDIHAAEIVLRGAGIDSSRSRVVSCEPDDLARWLSASDLGLVLRNSDAINIVASPTKLLEYARAGLLIVAGGIQLTPILLGCCSSCGDSILEFEALLVDALRRDTNWIREDALDQRLDAFCLPGASEGVFRRIAFPEDKS